MKSTKTTKRSYVINGRRRIGQALCESAVGLTFMTAFFVLATVFAVDAYAAFQNSASLRTVAYETSKAIQSKRYWLGRQRPDYTEDAEPARKEQYINIANALCERAGIPHIAKDEFQYCVESTDNVDYITVRLTLKDIKLPFRGLPAFPSVFTTSAYGSAAIPHDEPYAVLNIDAAQPGNPNAKLGVQIPVYGYFTGFGSQATPIGTTNASAYQATAGSLPNGFAPLCQGRAKYLGGLPMVPPTSFAQSQVTGGTISGHNF